MIRAAVVGTGTSFMPVKNSGPLYSSARTCASSLHRTEPLGRDTAWRQSRLAAVPLATKNTSTSRSKTSPNRCVTRAVRSSPP